jgi:hypothetical protein
VTSFAFSIASGDRVAGKAGVEATLILARRTLENHRDNTERKEKKKGPTQYHKGRTRKKAKA